MISVKLIGQLLSLLAGLSYCFMGIYFAFTGDITLAVLCGIAGGIWTKD